MASRRKGYEPLDVPYGYCHCGCGNKTSIAKENLPRLGHVKGEPVRYIAGHHAKRTDPLYQVDPETGCWVWQRNHCNRYGSDYTGGKSRSAHRMIYEQFVGEIPPGMVLDHICRNTYCVNPDHLEVVTQTENIRRGKGTKLNVAAAMQIRKEPMSKTHVELARIYGVSRTTISYIRKGKSWVKDLSFESEEVRYG